MDKFIPGFHPADENREACYVVFAGDELLMGEAPWWEPMDQSVWRFSGLTPLEQHYVGSYDGRPCYAVEVEPGSLLPPGYHWQSLLNLIARGGIRQAEFAMVGCGLQVFNWDRTHQYCGQCGNPTVSHPAERARICEGCKIDYYPRLSPCVIMLVTRGDECLLARHAHHPANLYTALAGFIEPGESAENALRREVAEEVSLQVTNLRYFGSQPWPFPGQLMLGFHADYQSGEIRVDDVEIADAAWWNYKDLPLIPPAGTLSGMLIRHFAESRARP